MLACGYSEGMTARMAKGQDYPNNGQSSVIARFGHPSQCTI